MRSLKKIRTFVEVTDIAKIVRKSPFLDFTDENSQSRTCKECEKKVFDFTDENSYKRHSCRILKIRNKWWSLSDLCNECEKQDQG